MNRNFKTEETHMASKHIKQMFNLISERGNANQNTRHMSCIYMIGKN